jgi:SAM-dependent methyltransferase
MPASAKSLKPAYFHDRNRGLAEQLPARRIQQGERELETFAILARLAGMTDLLDASKPTGFSLLDAGCGDKYIETASTRRDFRYIGLDVDSVDFETDALPIPDASIDLFVSLAVIEHLRDPSHFLTEAMRVLRPGGGIILSTPNFQMDFRNFYNDPTHVKPYTPAGLETVLRIAGYERIGVFPGLRCKPDWYYSGRNRFWKARWLLPFRGDARLAPAFLKGRSTSLFAIARKPVP